MKQNNILNVLYSIPVILFVLYFIPFLGIFLILVRYFMLYNNKQKRDMTPIIMLIVGILILIPKLINGLFNIMEINPSIIPYFSDICNSEIYNANFTKYSKLLLTVGVILLTVSMIMNKIFAHFASLAKKYIYEQERQDYEISQKNDLIMREKQEKAKNTHVVYCPYCGADNMLTAKTGTCKFCRRKIEYTGE